MINVVRIRPLEAADVGRAAALHHDELDMEFLTRYGLAFLRTYYRAWLEAPDAIALAAVDRNGDLVGVLLGATDPKVHVRGMVRRHGTRLGARIVSHAVAHPTLAKDLVASRGIRYTRGVARVVAARFQFLTRSPSDKVAGPLIAEITHVLVQHARQGMGIGRMLVQAAVAEARAGGREEMVLVTPPDLAARSFYQRLGWLADKEITSRSGEPFVRFRLPLSRPPTSDQESPPLPAESVGGPYLRTDRTR
ncbi:MAG: GNAT family N-acetyltransferase [Acidimicrobiales bacterium]|nr:GNAT family N-acetyltransferase [Acidimicrobiales bacterium]